MSVFSPCILTDHAVQSPWSANIPIQYRKSDHIQKVKQTPAITSKTLTASRTSFTDLLVGILQREGRCRAILPRLGAKVVIEPRARSHRLGVEVGRERAILQEKKMMSITLQQSKLVNTTR